MSTTPEQVLAVVIDDELADDAYTLRDYFVALLKRLWVECDGFSGKRPFGDSGWQWDVYEAMHDAGFIAEDDTVAGDALILSAIQRLGTEVTK